MPAFGQRFYEERRDDFRFFEFHNHAQDVLAQLSRALDPDWEPDLSDESLAGLAEKAEKMELRSERAKHRVEVQDPEYAKELVKLANKDAVLESQLS